MFMVLVSYTDLPNIPNILDFHTDYSNIQVLSRIHTMFLNKSLMIPLISADRYVRAHALILSYKYEYLFIVLIL